MIFSSSPAKIQNQLQQITHQVENPNSPFRQQQQAAINNATNWITNGKGYVSFTRGDDGGFSEILVMDTPDIATATKVWRWNNGGLGYSSTGYNGPYTTAITQDGSIVADFIAAGTLNAALITVQNLSANSITSGTLKSSNGSLTFDLNTGTFQSSGSNASMKFYNGVLTITDGGSIILYNSDGVGYSLSVGSDGYFKLPECSYLGYHLRWKAINGVPVLSHD